MELDLAEICHAAFTFNGEEEVSEVQELAVGAGFIVRRGDLEFAILAAPLRNVAGLLYPVVEE